MAKKTRKNLPVSVSEETLERPAPKPKPKPGVSGSPRQWKRDLQLGMGLIIVTFLVYVRVFDHQFLSYDDGFYVHQNDFVKAGLIKSSIEWAFTTDFFGNWHPLTWLSHMLDCQLFGLDPGWHHFTNVVFHCANTVLLFVALRLATQKIWHSAVVAGLFALHPLHVESVAWVAERKDVLSGFFLMVALVTYVNYAKSNTWKWYLSVIVAMALGLMSKPMLVTLPFALLLLDYWPLDRLQHKTSEQSWLASVWPLILEKIPLFGLSVISSIITYIVQQRGGAVKPLDAVPFSLRLQNTVVAYVTYLVKTVWPTHLAVLYPFPKSIPVWQVAGSTLLLLIISALVLWKARQLPFLIVGWLWFLGTLVPVIGLVQVGEQALADRYSYIPLIGVFLMAVWGMARLVSKWSSNQTGALAGLVLSVLAVCSLIQLGYWKDNISLYTHAMQVTKDNQICIYNLACALDDMGKTAEAIPYLLETIKIKPDKFEAYNNLGSAYYKQGKYTQASEAYLKATQIKPDFAFALSNLGLCLYMQNKDDEAIQWHLKAIKADPRYADARYNLGLSLLRKNDLEGALESFSAAIQINPNHQSALAQFTSLQSRLKAEKEKTEKK